MHVRRLPILFSLLAAVTARAADDDAAFFESKVRPLLAERCLECHSAEKKVKGGLRLDSREGWALGGDTGPALEPGAPEKSLLITAVRYHDKDLQMPPKKKLSDAEVATLEEWVRRGAPDPRTAGAAAVKKQVGLSVEAGRKFWAYVPPKRTAAPTVQDTAWPRGDIDRFVLASLEAKGMRPVADARPEVLARRLYLNLTGLPPTGEELDRFIADAALDRAPAVGRLVDDLLASPQFGATWGRHWLDVARFAESSGGGRTLLFKDAWRYRDYVVDAFNRDQPFDEFIREQVAGDLLPAASAEEKRRRITATAFLALGPTNYEEQDKQQLRFDVIDEQLDTLGKAVLGQTIGCARCHDHKFDPIPQRDYYALAGIFASTRTLANYTDNVARWIDAPLTLDGPDEEALHTQETRIAALKKVADAARKELARAKATVVRAQSGPGTSVAVADLPGIVVDDADAKAIGEWKHSTNVPSFIGAGYVHDLDTGKGAKTLTFTPKIERSGRYEVRLAYTPGANRAERVRVHVFHANGEEAVFVNERETPAFDGRFVTLGRFRFEKDGAGYVLVSNDGANGYVVADAVQFIAEEDILVAADVASTDDPAATAGAAKMIEARVRELDAALKQASDAGPRRPVAMSVRDDESPADTNIRVRGQVGQRGALVPRGFLAVVGSASDAKFPASGRRELADWLVSPANPLTARVFVNRAWHWLFGAGLVRTTDNFGTTGEAPSHPELLDHLALRFVEQGWSVKRLIREIVVSRTWQLAAGAVQTDPDNRLLSHANRRRLDAEQIRDAMLAVSGELGLDIGGPNIAGAGEINANDTSAQNIEYKYEFTDTRRSVYTPAFRNKRLELFEVFDFADINATTGRRAVSTVAPQALYFLNHPFVLAQSRLAAERALASSAADDERLTNAFRAALGRGPSAQERATCVRFLADADATAPRRAELWSQLYQSIFGCVDFRHLD